MRVKYSRHSGLILLRIRKELLLILPPKQGGKPPMLGLKGRLILQVAACRAAAAVPIRMPDKG